MNRFVTRVEPLWLVVLLATVLRCINIAAPMIGVHSWRQADTAAMVRNFYVGDMNIFFPQVDWGGNTSGYVESEFPLYQYLSALSYHALGFGEMWARLLSITASLIGVVLFHGLVRRISGKSVANWATAFYALLPLNIFYGRVVMPEPLMIMFSIVSLYSFVRWIQENKIGHLALSAISLALAALLKLPTLYLGLPLVYLAWDRFGWKFLRMTSLWIYAVFVVASVAAWYYHAHQILLNGGLTFGIWEYSEDKWGNWGLVMSIDFWNRILFQSISERHLTWFGLPLAIWGLSLRRAQSTEKVFDFWLYGILVYTVIVAKGNYVHEYYQLPAIIPLCYFIGKATSRFAWKNSSGSRWTAVVCFSGIVVLGSSRLIDYFSQENAEGSEEFALGVKLQQYVPPGSLIGVIDNNNPTILYLADRKGWHLNTGELNRELLRKLAHKGMRYWTGLRSSLTDEEWNRINALMKDSMVAYENEEMFIVAEQKHEGL